MIGKNRYQRRSEISEAKFRQLVRLFALDLTATDTAELTGLSLRSTNAIYQRIRARMAQVCAAQSPFTGELEADESYFGPKRIRGKRVVEQAAKPLCLVFSNEAAASTTRSSPTPLKPRCKPLCVAKLTPTA